MSVLKGLAGRTTPSAKIREIKSWVREYLPLSPETTILVTELTCTEPGCPPLETVIALLRGPGDQVQHKIHRGIAEVTREDVVALRTALAQSMQDKRNAPY